MHGGCFLFNSPSSTLNDSETVKKDKAKNLEKEKEPASVNKINEKNLQRASLCERSEQ